MDISILNPTQWGLIFTLTSMDTMTPLYEAMGLQLKEKPKFLELLRYRIIENRKFYEANPKVIPPFANRMMQTLESHLGKMEARNFYNWATGVFIQVHADQPQWSAWEMLFHAWSYNIQRQSMLELPIEKRDRLFSEYRRCLDLQQVMQQIAELKSRPLSLWDMEMYSIHQFNNEDEISDPFNTITHTIEINHFQLLWEQWLPQLSSTEKVSLWQEGQRLVVEREVWMPEPLKHPDSLRRLVC
ncbi:MAG: hypothetical protein BWK78_02410 [Thiotrichaceae bacterium IS1]|nr:MAG: hypothetical protein BWK78_02410 [Thiotrichaceae bacterium IS1]